MIKIEISGDAATVEKELQKVMTGFYLATTGYAAMPGLDTSNIVVVGSDKAEPAKRGPKPKVQVEAAPQPEPTPTPVFPTEKDVQDAVVTLNGKKGIETCMDVLSKFGVKRAREIREDQRAAFIKACEELAK